MDLGMKKIQQQRKYYPIFCNMNQVQRIIALYKYKYKIEMKYSIADIVVFQELTLTFKL